MGTCAPVSWSIEAARETRAPGEIQQKGTAMFKIQMLSLETLINLVVQEDWHGTGDKNRESRVAPLSRYQIEQSRSRVGNDVDVATDEVLQNV